MLAEDSRPLQGRGGTFIDSNGNIVQSSPAMLEAGRMEGREMLLAGGSQRPQALQQEDAGNQQASGNNFQFLGFQGFRWRSVLGVIVAVQLLMYLVSCWIVTPRALTSPNNFALWKIGSSNAIAGMCAVRDSFPRHLIELRRWVVPIFLHASPMHILMNLYFECSTGPSIEEESGPLRFGWLFIGSGVMGNLLSDSFGVNGVGGSTSCFGLIGMDMAIWYERWPQLEQWEKEGVKRSLMMRVGSLLLWEIIMWKEIDHFGHLGGFIGGALILLGRKDWRCVVLFTVILGICIWTICFKPLLSETYKIGEHQFGWQDVCSSQWGMYQITEVPKPPPGQ
mmetsp:Transcript_77441/g.134177  ORF Transcript_77441/g.134177 Transcript_77441/m.134177 type:complete len:337 (+) Transcript_77441:78-1088(+)